MCITMCLIQKVTHNDAEVDTNLKCQVNTFEMVMGWVELVLPEPCHFYVYSIYLSVCPSTRPAPALRRVPRPAPDSPGCQGQLPTGFARVGRPGDYLSRGGSSLHIRGGSSCLSLSLSLSLIFSLIFSCYLSLSLSLSLYTCPVRSVSGWPRLSGAGRFRGRLSQTIDLSGDLYAGRPVKTCKDL